jgi:hypothetical protein
MREISRLQTNVMIFIKWWAKTKNTPIPRSEIIKAMKLHKVNAPSSIDAINALLFKGYIRRGYSPQANKTIFVMIRNISDDIEYDFSQFENK